MWLSKGRIAYLPLEVETIASFVPDILNTDGLIVLVGGQPTKNNKVWTTAVDFRKVHVALTWLRQNNRLYKDIPAHSVEELEDIIQQRSSADNLPVVEPDDALLKS